MLGTPAGSGAADRDEGLIKALYAEHGGAVLAYAMRLTRGDRAAAEDVLQETLLRAWRHPEVLVNGRGSIRAWLLTVARNLVIDQARMRRARPAEVAENPGVEPAVSDHATGVVDSIVLAEALDGLSDEQRTVLVHLYFRGRTVREAADELGLPIGTVKSRSYHALRALRAAMSRFAPTSDGIPA
jgi:RNA polymerase sigma-70 factor, ECF subfamily